VKKAFQLRSPPPLFGFTPCQPVLVQALPLPLSLPSGVFPIANCFSRMLRKRAGGETVASSPRNSPPDPSRWTSSSSAPTSLLPLSLFHRVVAKASKTSKFSFREGCNKARAAKELFSRWREPSVRCRISIETLPA